MNHVMAYIGYGPHGMIMVGYWISYIPNRIQYGWGYMMSLGIQYPTHPLTIGYGYGYIQFMIAFRIQLDRGGIMTNTRYPSK